MDFTIHEDDRLNITNAIQCTYKLEDAEKGIDKLEQIYMMAKDCYYKGFPFLTDYSFDQLEEKIRHNRPDSKVLIKVGTSL